MSNLSRGQVVTLSPSGITAEVLYVRGDRVRVRNVNSGKERTVGRKQVTPKREGKVLSVGPLDPSIPTTFRVIDEAGPWPLIEAAILRPVPKPVTPKREGKVLTGGAAPMNSIADMLAPMQRVYDSSFRPVPKTVTLRSEPYLAYVRKYPCCLCGASGPSEAHQWSHHGGVMGSKCDDYRTVPLCQEHHRHWHDHGEFPRHDRDESEAIMLASQRELLAAWCENAVDRAHMVDALIRAIGGADA